MCNLTLGVEKMSSTYMSPRECIPELTKPTEESQSVYVSFDGLLEGRGRVWHETKPRRAACSQP